VLFHLDVEYVSKDPGVEQTQVSARAEASLTGGQAGRKAQSFVSLKDKEG